MFIVSCAGISVKQGRITIVVFDLQWTFTYKKHGTNGRQAAETVCKLLHSKSRVNFVGIETIEPSAKARNNQIYTSHAEVR